MKEFIKYILFTEFMAVIIFLFLKLAFAFTPHDIDISVLFITMFAILVMHFLAWIAEPLQDWWFK